MPFFRVFRNDTTTHIRPISTIKTTPVNAEKKSFSIYFKYLNELTDENDHSIQAFALRF